MKFKILQGSHYQDGTLYGKGDVVTSSFELDVKFGKNKFERVAGASIVAAKSPEDEKASTEQGKDRKSDKGPEKGVLADDQFDFSPEETGLHVYRNVKQYFVYDMDDMSEPLNGKGLAKSKVLPFIKSQTEE